MTLLHVVASMNPAHGGICESIRNSVEQLEKQNVTIEVVCLDDASAPFIQKEAFKIHALNHKGIWRYSSSLIPWLMDNVNRFDGIIVNGLWLYHSYAVYKAIQRIKNQSRSVTPTTKLPKVFIMPHGMLDPYFQKANNRKLKAWRNRIYWKIIENKVVNQLDGLLFTCEEELQLAREPFTPYHPKREVNIGLGIKDPPAFCDDMLQSFTEKCPSIIEHPYILFLGRIHEKKGVDILLNAYADLLNKQSAYKMLPKLVIAGPGLDTAYGISIQKLVSVSSRLKSMVIFTGMLSGNAKWGAFYGCEAFILPSHQENFGIAIVEAMACGKPVLISKRVNIWREIMSSRGGFIADDNLTGTRLLLAQWTQLTEFEKANMGESAKVCFHQHFCFDSATHKMLDVINTCL